MKTQWLFQDSTKYPKTELNDIPVYVVMWRIRGAAKNKGSSFTHDKEKACALADKRAEQGFVVETETQWFGGFI